MLVALRNRIFCGKIVVIALLATTVKHHSNHSNQQQLTKKQQMSIKSKDKLPILLHEYEY